MDWEKVTVKKNSGWEKKATDQYYLDEITAQGLPEPRKKMLPPPEMVYAVEEGYKGAHYDHFGYWLNAIRTGAPVAEDPVFGFRAAAPSLLCNDSYHQNKFINWDPVAMKLI